MRYNAYMSLVKPTLTIGFYTLISRVCGFVRDVTIAAALGASMWSDAFFVAFKLPNFLRRLFAEGAFNAAFVPLYAGMLGKEGPDAAKDFSSQAMSFLVAVLLAVTAVFMALMPWMMYLLAPGFSDDPAKFDLTVLLTRITFPYIIFISLVSLLGGVLNSMEKFAAVAATPIMMNLCLIIVPYFIEPLTPTPAHALSIAVLLAGVVQWLWLLYFVRKCGMSPQLIWPRLSDPVRKMLRLIAPAALGAGVAQINLFIDLIIASHLDSAVSFLYYADRINELPLAVIGIAVGTALLPMLSRQIQSGDHEKAQHTQNRAIELALLLSLPAAFGLMLLAEPLISVLFERGQFNPHDTAQTYPALIAFAAGLPAFVLVKVLAPGFYARHDTKTPFKIATICIGVNLVLNLLLMIPLKHVGMALATTIAGWLNVVLMLRILHREDYFRVDPTLRQRLPRIGASCIIMCVVLSTLLALCQTHWQAGTWMRFALLSGLVAAGMGAYGIAAYVTHATDRSQIQRLLRRRK